MSRYFADIESVKTEFTVEFTPRKYTFRTLDRPLSPSPVESFTFISIRPFKGYSGSTTVDLTENPTNQMSSWNTLPANYEDFQAELNHVKDGIDILQRLVTEYIQLEEQFRKQFQLMHLNHSKECFRRVRSKVDGPNEPK